MCEEEIRYGTVYDIDGEIICEDCIHEWLGEHKRDAEDLIQIEGE